jgi:uncharacterized protein
VNLALAINNLRRKIKRQYIQLLVEKSSSKSIAISFALGTFIAILPTPGFGVFIALMIAYFVKSLNNLSLLASFAFWNPLLLTPVYLLSYKIGDWFFDPAMVMVSEISWINTLVYYMKTYLIGNFISAIVLSVLCYFGIFRIMEFYKNKNIAKKLNRKRIHVVVPQKQIEAA